MIYDQLAAAPKMEMPPNSSGINISDVIEVIETDTIMEVGIREKPFIKIVEQPASKALRFRYECEGRSAGSIPGVHSTPENKTYPTIQIVNHKGPVVVIVSCVTKDHPHKPHPHNLVGRDGCKKGICTVEVHNESMTQSFDHLGIQCVKKKDIEEALKVRQEIRVDPFGTGFAHGSQPGSIDLNAVRLCFQAFLLPSKIPLQPVVSDIIYDKKALCDLTICKLSHCSASVAGGQEMILLCEKVAKEDISIRLFEERDGKIEWEGTGEFTPTQVHKQVAITFKTPKYKTLEVSGPVQVFIQLRRPTDGETSDPLPFQLTPLDSGPVLVSGELTRKKPKVKHDLDRGLLMDQEPLRIRISQVSPGLAQVKREPADASPNHYMMYPLGPSPGGTYRTPSPMDYNTTGQYNPLCPSTNVAYPVGSPLPPLLTALSPPAVQPTVGRASPQPATRPFPVAMSYQLPHNSPIYVPDPSIVETHQPITVEPNQARTFIEMAPMENITINSRDFPELNGLEDRNLSESLSLNLSLSSDANLPSRLQENMTDSFTRLANNAFNEFEG